MLLTLTRLLVCAWYAVAAAHGVPVDTSGFSSDSCDRVVVEDTGDLNVSYQVGLVDATAAAVQWTVSFPVVNATYAGIGFRAHQEQPSMLGLDIIAFDSTGSHHVFDYYVPSGTTLKLDSSQNVHVTSFSEPALDIATIVFYRELKVDDEYDFTFVMDEVFEMSYAIGAGTLGDHGETDALPQHSMARSNSVALECITPAPSAAPPQATAAPLTETSSLAPPQATAAPLTETSPPMLLSAAPATQATATMEPTFLPDTTAPVTPAPRTAYPNTLPPLTQPPGTEAPSTSAPLPPTSYSGCPRLPLFNATVGSDFNVTYHLDLFDVWFNVTFLQVYEYVVLGFSSASYTANRYDVVVVYGNGAVKEYRVELGQQTLTVDLRGGFVSTEVSRDAQSVSVTVGRLIDAGGDAEDFPFVVGAPFQASGVAGSHLASFDVHQFAREETAVLACPAATPAPPTGSPPAPPPPLHDECADVQFEFSLPSVAVSVHLGFSGADLVAVFTVRLDVPSGADRYCAMGLKEASGDGSDGSDEGGGGAWGDLAGYDVAIVDSSQPEVHDLGKGAGVDLPALDAQQDYMLYQYGGAGSLETRFFRKLLTGDANDQQLAVGSTYHLSVFYGAGTLAGGMQLFTEHMTTRFTLLCPTLPPATKAPPTPLPATHAPPTDVPIPPEFIRDPNCVVVNLPFALVSASFTLGSIGSEPAVQFSANFTRDDPTSTYAGFGFRPAPSAGAHMQGYDMLIVDGLGAWVDYGVTHGYYVQNEDVNQDFIGVLRSTAGKGVEVQFARKLDTGDNNDVALGRDAIVNMGVALGPVMLWGGWGAHSRGDREQHTVVLTCAATESSCDRCATPAPRAPTAGHLQGTLPSYAWALLLFFITILSTAATIHFVRTRHAAASVSPPLVATPRTSCKQPTAAASQSQPPAPEKFDKDPPTPLLATYTFSHEIDLGDSVQLSQLPSSQSHYTAIKGPFLHI
ncbi:hypothetical protein DIPPA_15056 [Diplonema papillatum]|nr:hypothetical protein DIPPA_15056 [Diplonema papillatum]